MSSPDACDRLETGLIARLEQLGNNLERQMAADLRTTIVSMFGMILAMGGFIVGFA